MVSAVPVAVAEATVVVAFAEYVAVGAMFEVDSSEIANVVVA